MKLLPLILSFILLINLLILLLSVLAIITGHLGVFSILINLLYGLLILGTILYLIDTISTEKLRDE